MFNLMFNPRVWLEVKVQLVMDISTQLVLNRAITQMIVQLVTVFNLVALQTTMQIQSRVHHDFYLHLQVVGYSNTHNHKGIHKSDNYVDSHDFVQHMV